VDSSQPGVRYSRQQPRRSKIQQTAVKEECDTVDSSQPGVRYSRQQSRRSEIQ
jgi:hypothetical protein